MVHGLVLLHYARQIVLPTYSKIDEYIAFSMICTLPLQDLGSAVRTEPFDKCAVKYG